MKSFIKKLLKNKYFYFLLACLAFFAIMFSYSLKEVPIVTVSYDSKYNTSYDVYIYDSEFYNTNVLGMERQYIARLIDYIKIKNIVNYKFSSKIFFSYVTDISSKVTVKNTNTEKNLLELEEENYHVNEKVDSKKSKSLDNEVNIDFNKYNDLVKRFVEEYNLKSTSSTLEVTIKVKLNGNKNSISENFKDSMVIKYIMPLNEETIDIKTEYISNNNDINYFTYSNISEEKNNYIVLLTIDLFLIIFIVYKLFGDTFNNLFKKLSTNEEKLESIKILKKYGAFINEVKTFNFNKYKDKITLLSFEALLDIKDTSNCSIFMKRGRNNVYFFILQQNRLFIYTTK